MRDHNTPKDVPAQKMPTARLPPPAPTDDGFEDEEKLLEGQKDVNMPALLTRDVKGG